MKTTKKLSLDELERASGGVNLGGWTPVAPDDFGLTFGGELMNAQACREVLGGIYDTFGEDYAIEYAKKPENEGKMIVALLPDSGDRYYSTPLFTE